MLRRGRDGWAGVALGLAAAVKLTPLVLVVPALVGGRARPARFLAGLVPALLVPYLPYLLRGGAFGSLFESGTTWLGGSLAYAAVRVVLPAGAARAVCAALVVGGALWIARRLRGRPATARAFAWTATLLVVCLPVVHAWYWLTPLALGLAAGEVAAGRAGPAGAAARGPGAGSAGRRTAVALSPTVRPGIRAPATGGRRRAAGGGGRRRPDARFPFGRRCPILAP